uniref:RNA-directed DNA polymerase n=1 Tax=Meloidogyne hapla TaxID=6305 RepID=A0A1I8BLH5_MELHA
MALLSSVKKWWKSHECKEFSEQSSDILHMRISEKPKWLTKKVLVNGSEVEFILDSGAQITCVSENTWKCIGSPKLIGMPCKGKSFTGNQFKMLGSFIASIEVDGVQEVLETHVTSENWNLFGLPWIIEFESKLNYPIVSSIKKSIEPFEVLKIEKDESEISEIVKRLSVKFKKVFEEGLGHCTKMKAHLHLKPGVKPVFVRPRPVPIGVKDAIEKELNRLSEMGAIKPIEFANWAAPILAIKKANGKTRVCMDYSTGLNNAIELDRHPLPKPSEIWAEIHGSKVFSQLDLRDAYLQIELDESSKKLTCSWVILFLKVVLNQIPEKKKKISDLARPKDVKELKSFMGTINYYGRFVSEMHKLRGPLDKLLKKEVKWEWSKEQEDAFQSVKKVLSSNLLLTHFDPELEIIVTADASNYGVGAVISHRFPDGKEKVIEYASKSLNAAEKNYSQIEKEGLALVYAVQKFHKMLYGRKFVLRTDHKPLLAIFCKNKGIKVFSASRLQRWALLLTNYDFKIEFVRTDHMGMADTLSRLISESNTSEDKVIALVTKEESSEDEDSVEESAKYVLNIMLNEIPVNNEVIKSETEKDTELSVVKSRITRPNYDLGQKTDRNWERVHIDFAGPCKDGKLYLIVIDANSKWPEVFGNMTTSAKDTIKCLEWLGTHYGYPETIVSDNGSPFRSNEFKVYCENRGISQVFSAPYHPQSNGQVERFVDYFKRMMIKNSGKKDWLQEVLLFYRASPHVALEGKSPAEVFLGRKLRLKLARLMPRKVNIRNSDRTLQQLKMKKWFDSHHGVKNRKIEKEVHFLNYRNGRSNWLQGEVIKKTGVIYKIYSPVLNAIVTRHENQIRNKSVSSKSEELPTWWRNSENNFSNNSNIVKKPEYRQNKYQLRTNIKPTQRLVVTRDSVKKYAEAPVYTVPRTFQGSISSGPDHNSSVAGTSKRGHDDNDKDDNKMMSC